MANKREKEVREDEYMDAGKAFANVGGGGPSTFRVPEGLENMRLKEGANEFDVLPIKSPDIKSQRENVSDPGRKVPVMIYFAHGGIGPNGTRVVCNWNTFGEPCYCCDQRRKLLNDGRIDQKAFDKMAPRPRVLFIARDYKDGKKVKTLESSVNLGLGELFKNKLSAKPPGHRYHGYYRADEKGMVLSVTCKDKPMGDGGTYKAAPVDLELEPRDAAVPKDDLKKVPDDVSELLVKLSYEEMEEIFQGGAKKKDEDEDERPSRNGKAKAQKDDDDSDDDDDDSDDDDSDDDDKTDDEIEVGSEVTFIYKGKKKEGTVKKINAKKGVAEIEVEGQDKVSVVDLDELSVIEKDDDDSDDDDDDDDEDARSQSSDDDDDDDSDDDDSDDDDDKAFEDDDQDDDDDDDSDDDDDKPARGRGKAGAKKPAGRRK